MLLYGINTDIGKFLQSNGHSTSKMHSDNRDSDVHDGFVEAH
jgi:hypothetical protein